ncbi:hypothetical protein Pan258_22170 [Symmachiella dynata]|uniref:tetratricopeptide repeat protein n=1 Tax=Symmachiella dynata TaxID=2527995 RepID=UPI0011899D12|nr:hypothetical protein [Symmachiella dynata]QDT48177.1 hypothetical protein Pan258_22170 [Symmachiella dynata]
MNPLFERAKERGVDPKTLIALEKFESDIARDPYDAYAYANMGCWWHWKQEYAKALDHLNTAIRLDGNFAYALCSRADLRATCPDAAYRDSEAAVDDATKAFNIARIEGRLNQDWQHRMFLRVLAAAHAEAGNYGAAIEIENEALRFTITKSATRKITTRLAKYESCEPIRDERGIIGHGPVRKSINA